MGYFQQRKLHVKQDLAIVFFEMPKRAERDSNGRRN